MTEFLCRTGNKVLVEASPVDAIWGIGMASDGPGARDPSAWKGLNLLGFALMVVRERIASRGSRVLPCGLPIQALAAY